MGETLTINITGLSPRAIEDVITERRRQVGRKGYDAAHDDAHDDGELALAAACFATPTQLYMHETLANEVRFFDPFPWEQRDDSRPYDGNVIQPNSTLKPVQRRRQLVVATSLLLAEIDRLDRASA